MEISAEQLKALWGEMADMLWPQLQFVVAGLAGLVWTLRMMFRPTKPEDSTDAAHTLRSKLAKSLAAAQVEAWVTAILPMADAIQEALRESSGEVKKVLEILSEQIGRLFQTYANKYKDFVSSSNKGTRDAMV